MSCRKYKKLIDESVGGTLPERLANELQAHLAGCPDCAAAYAELAGAVALVKGLERDGTTPQFMAELRAKLRLAESLHERPVRRTSVWERILPAHVARPLAVGAVALLLLVVAVGPPHPVSDSIDLAQTDFAQFCVSQYAETTDAVPIENQATQWLDSAPVQWTENGSTNGGSAANGEADG